MYEERFYRKSISSKFKAEVSYKESDLLVCTDKNVNQSLIKDVLRKHYKEIEAYSGKNHHFLTSLSPLKCDKQSPLIVRNMYKVSQVTGIGPFSAVAGAIAKYVGEEILNFCSEVIIENGGDIFLKINEDKLLGIYSGDEIARNDITLRIKKRKDIDKVLGVARRSAAIEGVLIVFGQEIFLWGNLEIV